MYILGSGIRPSDMYLPCRQPWQLCDECFEWTTEERRKYRRRLINYIQAVEKARSRPLCYSRSVSKVLDTYKRAPSPVYIPTFASDDEVVSPPHEDPTPSITGPSVVRWAAQYNPELISTTSTSSYAPGYSGFEGPKTIQNQIFADPGVSGAFLRGLNSHLQVPATGFPETLDLLATNLHAATGSSADPHKPLPIRYWDFHPRLASLFKPDTLALKV